jgi:hypothetical protein
MPRPRRPAPPKPQPPRPPRPAIDPGAPGQALFARLDPALPLALLPVRLETRFSRPPAPPQLWVRIFPDAIHADGHESALSTTEQDVGRAFWEQTWRAAGDVAGKDDAFAWLAGQLGPWRAAWVARQLTPTNPRQAPAEAVPAGQPLDPAPRFPAVETSSGGGPSLARLLPTRFAVIGYYDNEAVGTWWGAEIPEDLQLAPGLADAPDLNNGSFDGGGLLDTQGLTWTYDFDEAVRVGMGLRIDLAPIPKPVATEGFSELLVLGVRLDDQREGLEALLEAHRYTDGLELAPQGMATNVTDTTLPALSPDDPDLAALRAAELDDGPRHPSPAVANGGDLYRMHAADAVGVALGVGPGGLDRTTNAGGADLAYAEAMNRALWPGSLGYYLDHLVQGAVVTRRDWLRDWSSSYVRGGGPLPTLLVGPQPYGLLPVGLVEDPDQPAGELENLEGTISALRRFWDASLPAVPRLDPDVADAPPQTDADGSLSATVSQVLGSVPHPTLLRLRETDKKRADYTSAYNGQVLFLGFLCSQFSDANGNPFPSAEDNPAWRRFEQLQTELEGDQLHALTSAAFDFGHTTAIDDVPFTSAQLEQYQALGDYIQEHLVPLVAAHADRVAPILPLFLERVPSITGQLGDDDDPEAFFAYHGAEGTEVPWSSALVAADLEELRGWLGELVSELPDHAGEPYDYTEPGPLLRQWLRWSVANAGDPGDRAAAGAGLTVLATLAETEPDAVAILERLLREALGCGSYRLDAWYTGVGADRLESRRARRARGIQAGAYGFVVDLAPRDTRPSQGHIAAPSLSQATTAAILRAGWSAFGGDAETAGLAVDLSSDRIRRASWIVEGVARGEDLAELLGSRLERSLHDAGLDPWIEPLRSAALEAVGNPNRTNGIVDGLLLARARSGASDLSATETAARDAVDALLKAPDRPAGDPETILAGLVHDLDAAADAAVAQSVFSLAEGNTGEATATLTAAGSGDGTFPRLRFADTPRPALTVTHRLLVVVDPGATGTWPGAVTSGRALAAPALEAWVESLIGDPAALRFEVSFADPARGTVFGTPAQRSLADVGLAALDLISLAPRGEETGAARLGSLLAAWAESLRPSSAPPDAAMIVRTDIGERTIDDALLGARPLYELVAAARDLDGRDLAAPGTTDPPSGLDVAELDDRVDAVADTLSSRGDALAAAPADGDLRSAMLALNGFGLAGAVPRATDLEALATEGAALLAAVQARLAAYQSLVAEEADGWDALDELGRHKALAGRMRALLGESLPLAPYFTPANGAELEASAGRPRLGGRAGATAWLAASGRVDPGARRLRVALDLLEAAADATLFDFRLAQLPDHAGEGWAAVTRPSADDRGRLCLLATGDSVALAASPLAGLVLGAWSEQVPGARQEAGVSFHFDAPGSRAPQAVLLCTPRPAGRFDFELVQGMVRQTLDLARLRQIGPETLQSLGQYLPGVVLPQEIAQ